MIILEAVHTEVSKLEVEAAALKIIRFTSADKEHWGTSISSINTPAVSCKEPKISPVPFPVEFVEATPACRLVFKSSGEKNEVRMKSKRFLKCENSQ